MVSIRSNRVMNECDARWKSCSRARPRMAIPAANTARNP